MLTSASSLGRVFLCERAEDLAPVHALLASDVPIAVDTEGTGLDPYRAGFRVRTVQVGTLDRAYTIPSELAGELVARLNRPVYMHNRTFDCLALEQHFGRSYATLAPLVTDTMLLSRVRDPRMAHEGGTGRSLSDLSKALLGIDDKGEAHKALQAAARKLKIKTADMWRDVPVATPEYWQYAAQDTILTARLATVLDAPAGVVEFEHRLAYDLGWMQRAGILLDREWAEKAKAEYERELEQAENTLRRVVAPSGAYAHKAIPQLVEAFRAAGVTRWPSYTPTGRERLTQAVLDKFLTKGKPKVAALAREVKSAQQARHFGGYVEDFLSRVGRDGRVHPTIQSLAAKTGRMAISSPPLQQLPRDDYRLRGCFVAAPGNVLVGCDYSQIEVRVAAAVCSELGLEDAIRAREDVYMRVADIMGGPEHRQIAKTALLGKLYGAGPKKLQQQTGVTLETAYKVVDALNTAYPELERFTKKLSAYVEAHPDWWPKSMTGRSLPMDPDRPWAALNRIVQPEAREVMAEAVVRWFEAGYGDASRLVVHDEGIFEVPEDEAECAAEEISKLMTTKYRNIPLDAEAKVLGERWKKT